MIEITFLQILNALDKIGLPKADLVIGIAQGGIVPAGLVAQKLGCDLRIVHFNYRNRENKPVHKNPILLNKVSLPPKIRNILIVDDVSISGKTLEAAKKLFKGRKITTVVFRGKADYMLFPEIYECVKWPWRL
jgi:hypoxanthine phosphoribosyltransferase